MLNKNLALKLKNQSLLTDKSYVNGKWIKAKSGDTFEVKNPATNEVIATLPVLSREETAVAIESAKTAQQGWADMTAKNRAEILNKFYELMIENADDLAIILTAEMGKPIIEAKGEIIFGASYIQWFAEEGKRMYGDIIPPVIPNTRTSVIKQPIGVVASITPWNFPSAMIARKIAPALASGCCFVGLPASNTPLSALAIAVIAEKAKIPNGVINIITSNKSSEIGKEFCENQIVRKLSFTGSTRVGKILTEQSAPQVMKLSLELGGNAPFIIFDDADIDKAVEGALICKFRNNGQTCICANRIYIQSGIYDEFVMKFKNAVEKLIVGDGFQDGISNGPMINQDAINNTIKFINDAVSKGAKIISGGKLHQKGGLFFEPTLLTNCTTDMLVSCDEIFGPIAPLFKFDTEEEVLKKANDTVYGLASYFYSNDINRVIRLQEKLEFGMVGVNTGIITSESAPFGGIKQSGQGREGSKYGLDDYTELKYISTAIYE